MELRAAPVDIVTLDRAAVLETVRLVDAARPGDWPRPTPCDRWTLRELVAHMAAQHHGFAAAARGEGADATAWLPPDLGDDPAGAYRSAAGAVLDAFARPGVTGMPFTLPEIGAGTVPGHRAVGFHLVDHMVHAWDVAATLGLRALLPEPVLRAALPIALAVPGGDARRAPGSAFGPALPPDGGSPGALSPELRSTLRPNERAGHDGPGTLPLILRSLGRSPGWTPPDGR